MTTVTLRTTHHWTKATMADVTPQPDQKIRDAACMVVVDRIAGVDRLLMGRRRADQVFLPNKWVFPGGRLDSDDYLAGADGCTSVPASLRPFVCAARRELTEETSFYLDAATSMSPLARAITPPGRPRRYDTWFFLADGPALQSDVTPDGELLDLNWYSIDEARRLDIPNITKLVLEDAAARLANRPAVIDHVPFYFDENGRFMRKMLSLTDGCGISNRQP